MKNKIVVVGGGTAGWVTLAYLAATTDADLTIIHSDEIDIIGVGESTTPTVAEVARAIGVDQKKWMKDAKATFKFGVNFRDFAFKGSRWLHTFDDMLPAQAFTKPLTENGKAVYKKEITSVDFFLQHFKQDVENYNLCHGPLELMVQKRLSPFDRDQECTLSGYPGYAYHINAFEFGNSLRKHTSKDRYTEIVQKVVDVRLCDNGVDHLLLEDGSEIQADLFVDCTGFKKLLIGKLSQWKSYSELSNNSAVWGQVKGVTSDHPATGVWAQEAGWIWEIPTWQQIGSGYVYCDRFSSEERAVDVISSFWKNRGYQWHHAKSIKFDAGRQEHPGIKNVVSNGLAQSFIEPLEATSIMITCSSVKALSLILNKHTGKIWDADMARAYSKTMINFVDHNKKFIHYHYKLSSRNDTPYWQSVANKPNAVKEVCDIADDLFDRPWTSFGETSYNQWNWIAMLLGFDKTYVNDLPVLDQSKMERYLFYTDMLKSHYEFLTKDNIPIKEYLEMIHS